MTQPQAPARLYLWPHRMLYLGPGFGTGQHRHHAAQLCVDLHNGLKVRRGADGLWQKARALLIPPDYEHEIGGFSSLVALLYFEAEGVEYASLRGQLGADPQGIMPIAVDASWMERLVAIANAGSSTDEAEQTCRKLLQLPAVLMAESGLDGRIARAQAWISSRIDQPIKLRDVAREVGLSSSHLGHLFTDSVGIPLRRYILWTRLRRAIERTMQGSTLTEAAHQAGFSDSAHLSRTFRSMFGITPSFLVEHRSQFDIKLAL